MCMKWPIYILTELLENLHRARFSFYRQSQFLHTSPYMVFERGIPTIDSKPFPMDYWRNWHLFEYQKHPNRKINNKVTEFSRFSVKETVQITKRREGTQNRPPAWRVKVKPEAEGFSITSPPYTCITVGSNN